MKLAIAFVFISLGVCHAQVNLSSGLNGYFTLDGNAQDGSITSIHGVNNGASSTVGYDGLTGSGMSFSESQQDYIDAGNDTRGITDEMSVSFWFRTTGTGTYHMIEKYNWTLDAGFYIRLQGGQICFQGRDGSGVGIVPPLSTDLYNDGIWHHAVAILDINVWSLYVDCQLVSSLTTSSVSPDISVPAPLTFGRHVYYDDKFYEGDLDEIRVYNRVLTSDEICALCGSSFNATSDLTGQFGLDGNAEDASVTAIDGVNNGAAATFGFEGISGSAMNFSAAQLDYIDAGTDTRSITDEMSVSFWFKTTGTGIYHMIEKYDWTQDAGFYIRLQAGQICFQGRDGSGVGIVPALSSALYNDGVWHHVVAVLDVNLWSLYVDCQLVSTLTTSSLSPDISVNAPLTFGRYYHDNDKYYDGDLDEILIYSRALSEAEICHLCNNQQMLGASQSTEVTSGSDDLVIYPNPTTGELNLIGLDSAQTDYKVVIRDLSGQIVGTYQNVSRINISEFANGMYFVEVTSSANPEIVFSAKIVKTN